MNTVKNLILAFALTIGAMTIGAVPASAADADPILIKVINDDAHRMHGALHFAQAMAQSGHPVIVWITDRAVRVASKDHAGNLSDAQPMLNELLKQNARIVLCPMCMKEYGVAEVDLIPGVTIGNPNMISQILFKENAKTITW